MAYQQRCPFCLVHQCNQTHRLTNSTDPEPWFGKLFLVPEEAVLTAERIKNYRPSAAFPGLRTASRHSAAGARSHPAEYVHLVEVVLFRGATSPPGSKLGKLFSGTQRNGLDLQLQVHNLRQSSGGMSITLCHSTAAPSLWRNLRLHFVFVAQQLNEVSALQTEHEGFMSSKTNKKNWKCGTHGLEHPKNSWIEEEGKDISYKILATKIFNPGLTQIAPSSAKLLKKNCQLWTVGFFLAHQNQLCKDLLADWVMLGCIHICHIFSNLQRSEWNIVSIPGLLSCC